jgi:beta-lactamase superfamily II metal-dependent hydrolase
VNASARRRSIHVLRLHVVQAEYGDCFLLEYGTPPVRRYLLVDGGPMMTYERHLGPELLAVAACGGKLDLVMLSHVDSDHVGGLLDLMRELQEQRAEGCVQTIAIDALWHNAFDQTSRRAREIGARLQATTVAANGTARMMTAVSFTVQGINQGHQLSMAAAALGIPVNPGFPTGCVLAHDASQPVRLDNLMLRVLGPSQTDLDELEEKWMEWLDEQTAAVASGDPFRVASADRSVPNLSSIMVLAQADGKSILFTGDGSGDHLLNGLKESALLDSRGRLSVDVLKVPHHGSDRSVSKSFFQIVLADRYVISANGRDGHPSLATMIWIVETARRQRREVEIAVTNPTASTQQLLAQYPADEYGYTLTVMDRGAHSMVLDLVP